MKQHKSIAGILLLVMVLAGSACSGLTQSDKPATVRWWLSPYTGLASTTPASPAIPVELSVTAIPGLDTDRILALSEAAELKPFIGASWVDYLPDLVESLIGRSLEASGRFSVDSGSTPKGMKTCRLRLELAEFFADLDAAGQTSAVRVSMNGSFQCATGDLSPISASARMPANDQRMKVIVAAFQSALDKVTKDMLAQIP